MGGVFAHPGDTVILGATVRSILLVDDEPEFSQMTRQILESAGYTVACAADGLEAVQLLARESFDLLLTDLLMPNRDGLELIGTVHKDYPGLRIIAMSGGGHMSADMYLQMARGFNVDGLLHKPFNPQELLSAVRAIETRAMLPCAPCSV